MNNEFQWRNEMRKLGGAVDPARDLWPAIAARIDEAPALAPASARRRRAGWMAIAATLIVGAGTATTAYRWQRSEPVVDGPTIGQTPADPAVAIAEHADRPPGAERSRTALDWAVPADPQLAATAENLDSASAQLQDALERRPDAVFLVGLLNRTNAQRLRLMRKSPYAG
jgi:hypothetical protein